MRMFKDCLLYTSEFEQMELEFFCKPGTELEWFSYWKDYCHKWLLSLGMRDENLRLRDVYKRQVLRLRWRNQIHGCVLPDPVLSKMLLQFQLPSLCKASMLRLSLIHI